MLSTIEEQDFYTITIIKNIGVPISFTIKKWKLLGLAILFGSSLLFTSYFTLLYLFSGSERNELSRGLEETQKKVDLLISELSEQNQEKFTGSGDTIQEKREKVRASLVRLAEFSPVKILTQKTSHLTVDDIKDNIALEITEFTAWRKRNAIYFSTLLKNTSIPLSAVGGYVAVTLQNEDVDPPVFVGIHGERLGKNGYPSNYKKGGQYYLTRRQGRKQFKFILKTPDEYYTNAEFFLYSYKGRLITRRKFDLAKTIFTEDNTQIRDKTRASTPLTHPVEEETDKKKSTRTTEPLTKTAEPPTNPGTDKDADKKPPQTTGKVSNTTPKQNELTPENEPANDGM